MRHEVIAHAMVDVDLVVMVRPDGVAFLVDLAGIRRRAAARDAAAAAAAAARAAVDQVLPEGVSAAIPAAPARGPVQPFAEDRTVRNADGTERIESALHLGRTAVRVSDAFDRMAAAAARAGGVPPFTPGQVAMGRDYARLHERWQASGMRGMSLEVMRGGGSGGDFIEAVLRDRARLDIIRGRIGNGIAVEVRRQRPSSRRRAIADRALVDAVCLADMTLDDVLVQHHWDRSGKTRAVLRDALAAALDRMQGPVYRPRRHVFFGQMPAARGLDEKGS